jgi:hypothetical protein
VGGARCADAPGRGSSLRCHGDVQEIEGILVGGDLGQWGGGLLTAMRKGSGGGRSASGMVLGARRIENGTGIESSGGG